MKIQKTVASLLSAAILTTSLVVPASATSASKSASNKSLGATIRSDAWIQTISDWDGTGEFQVTAAYSSKKKAYKKPSWVKTSWDFYAQGISAGVSYKKVSASVSGYGSTSTSSGYWKNSNGAKTAWWRGRVGGTGLCFYVGLYNTASAFKAGVPLSTTAKI